MKEVAAMKDCVEELSDSVDELKRSMGEMSKVGKESRDFKIMINDIQTWVSAALTDESTCSDGFGGNDMNGNLKTVVRGKIVNVAQLTSNALALINKYALIHGHALFGANLKLMTSPASQGDSSVNNPRNQVVDAPPLALAAPLPVVAPTLPTLLHQPLAPIIIRLDRDNYLY
ncbi:hypothetical protein F8388_000340 [Cannabis sativa]|uniref:Pectinesterase inhibitor domain-containing protein n=1 Tax=Cannabis sativa TaxID=3483 RepID=A0A7J6GR68_CANSA|nr:hypothetical protein F8388_000340 [Cannabis sativa]KAF4385425.1 hypothetical protein G4B88_005757 [Cannabis sativa]